nr:hypothetical protein BaRGS_028350 [Batillaria attramentaria]
MLGIPSSAPEVHHGAAFGPGNGSILLDEVRCVGTERDIFDCIHDSMGASDCDHNEDVGVSCPTTLNARLVNGSDEYEGRLELFRDGQWGTVCGEDFDQNDAMVVCRMMGLAQFIFNSRVILERMREAVDPMLRDQQAGFRRNRSCADQIASLRIIVEQSLEWNSPLYINFIDYEKAFDNVAREALWKLLRYYGVPGKIISLVWCTCQDMSCRTAHAGQLSESFEVKTGVRQGCLLSPFLFFLIIDWIMKTTTTGRKSGIQ